MRSFWLCKKDARKRALRYEVERPNEETARVTFDVFEPRTDREVPNGTVTRAKATCLCCGAVLPPERVRAQLGAALPITWDFAEGMPGEMWQKNLIGGRP